MLGGAFGSKNSTVCHSLAFQMSFFVSFHFIMISFDFILSRYHERLKPSTKVEDEASSLINDYVLIILCKSIQCLINLLF
jgi:hypothetical protein